MKQTKTIRTEYLFRGIDIKKMLAEKFDVPVENVKCTRMYSFKVCKDEEIEMPDGEPGFSDPRKEES